MDTTPTLDPAPVPKVTPKLAQTPMQVPIVRTYMAGDFLRAFGFPEEIIRTVQEGVASGFISAVVVKGVDYLDLVQAETVFSLSEFFGPPHGPATVLVDTASSVSVTEQMSRRFAQAILYCVDQVRRRGLRVEYAYRFSPLGQANREQAFAQLGLKPARDRYAAGIRQVFSITHAPTGSTLTHSST